jgi:hypothetical protein
MTGDTIQPTQHPLSADVRQRCVKSRTGLDKLAEEERRALDTYYSDRNALRLLIREFSPGEDRAKLAWRRDMTVDHFENHVAEIGDSYAEIAYGAGEVTRKLEGADALNAYLKDRYAPFWEGEVAPIAPYMPELYCYLDMPPAAGGIASHQAQVEAEAWARPSLVFGSSVVALDRDRDGRLTWISRRMEHRERVNGREKTTTWYEVRDALYIYALDGKGEPIPMLITGDGERVAIHPHGMAGVPVVAIVRRRTGGGSGIGTAMLKPVVDKTIAALQLQAMLIEMGYLHLSMDLVADPETIEEMRKEGGRGNATVIPVPRAESTGEKVVAPAYIGKPLGVFDTLFQWAFQIMPASIYRSARLRDRSTSKTMNQSGIAKAFDAVPETAAIKSYASWLRNPDAECVRLIARSFMPDVPETAIICDYPSQYAPQAAGELIADVTEIADRMLSGALPRSGAMLIEFLTTILRDRFPDMPRQKYDAVVRDLEAAAAAMGEDEAPTQTSKPADPFAPVTTVGPDGIAYTPTMGAALTTNTSETR